MEIQCMKLLFQVMLASSEHRRKSQNFSQALEYACNFERVERLYSYSDI